MRLREWFALRGPRYVLRRAAALRGRYGPTPSRAMKRVAGWVQVLAEAGCAPTLPTPGRVVDLYPDFVRQLQDAGAEIAVHSYDHVDLSMGSLAAAVEQLTRAAHTFRRHGVEVHGFRCPYLRCREGLLAALPAGLFGYSSNQAVYWDALPPNAPKRPDLAFATINRLYAPLLASQTPCVPWMRSGTIEIPACVPDDLQICDGLRLGPEGLARVWRCMLEETHRRGEVLNLLSHPELVGFSEAAFVDVLGRAKRMQPAVWIARLRDVAEWWRERARFAASTTYSAGQVAIELHCSRRATILVRGLPACGPTNPWDGVYRQLACSSAIVPAEPRPFVGLPAEAPPATARFLQEQGYLLEIGDGARLCGTFLEAGMLEGLNPVELIEAIESSPAPLVKYGRWPLGARSALCVTGDLDALTLLDYASRLLVRQGAGRG